MKYLSVLVLVALAIMSFSCKESFSAKRDRFGGVVFEFGENKDVIKQTIGKNGAEIAIKGTKTPLDGITFSFPPFAKETEISIGYNTGFLEPNEGEFGGVVFYISPDIEVDNTTPIGIIEISVTGVKKNNLPVPYLIKENGSLSLAQMTENDSENGSFKFMTFHGGMYTWIYAEDLFGEKKKK